MWSSRDIRSIKIAQYCQMHMCLLSLDVGSKYLVNVTYCHFAIREFFMLSEIYYRYCVCQNILSNIFHVLKSYFFYFSMSQFHLDGEWISELNTCLSYSLFGELWTVWILVYPCVIFILTFMNFIMLRHINFIFIRVYFFRTLHIIVRKFVGIIGRIGV